MGGGALGTASGLPGGSLFGKELGRKISKLIGSGDYEVSPATNDLFKGSYMLPSASFAADNNDYVRIRRREFIQDITTDATTLGKFINWTYSINAGLHGTFPFLSQVAANYEEYCFDGLVFEFISSASPYVTGSALGTVVASMEYNSSMPPFTTKFTMENSAHAVSTRLDKNLMYGVECAKGSNAQNCYYVRNGTSTLPPTTTDLGLFQLALAPSIGVPLGTVVGELWVTYDVVLKRPYISGATGLYHRMSGSGSSTAPFGTNTIAQSNLGSINFSYTNGTTLSFQNAAVGDSYLGIWHYTGTGAGVVVAYPTITYVGATAVNALALDSASTLVAPLGGVTTTVCSMLFTFTATATSGSVIFGAAGTLPAGSISIETFISYVGPNVLPALW